MALVTVTRNYQITLPEDVRKRKSIKEGERLVVRVDRSGRIVVEKVATSIAKRTFGRWKDEVSGVEYVDALRTGWKRRSEVSSD